MNNTEYITIKEASKKWNMDVSKIGKLIRSNRISGVTKIGCHWLIPASASKPLDNRTKLSKNLKKENIKFFRYPNYFYQDINAIYPPLESEEKIVKELVEEFLACNFQNAKRILSFHPCDKMTNKYCKIFVLYVSSMIDIVSNNKKSFLINFDKLSKEYKNDFPYKKEMSYLLHEINTTLGYDKYFFNGINLDSTYNYHNSFLPHLVELYVLSLYYNKSKTIADINACEISSLLLEESKYPVEMQSIYVYLGSSYALISKTKEAIYYYKKALNIAYKYNSYYGVIDEYFYMKTLFDDAIKDFPREFITKINELSKDVHNQTANFIESISNNSIYNLFPQKDYILILYAVCGYTNKEVAALLGLSEISIGKRYSKLYEIANVKGKAELVNLYNNSFNSTLIK